MKSKSYQLYIIKNDLFNTTYNNDSQKDFKSRWHIISISFVITICCIIPYRTALYIVRTSMAVSERTGCTLLFA